MRISEVIDSIERDLGGVVEYQSGRPEGDGRYGRYLKLFCGDETLAREWLTKYIRSEDEVLGCGF